MVDSHDVPAPIRDLAAQMAQAKPMRRGSVSERYIKCSKPGCPCAGDPQARHGPYFNCLPKIVSGLNECDIEQTAPGCECILATWRHFQHWISGVVKGTKCTVKIYPQGIVSHGVLVFSLESQA